jgi:hypothetical protein
MVLKRLQDHFSFHVGCGSLKNVDIVMTPLIETKRFTQSQHLLEGFDSNEITSCPKAALGSV